MHKNRNAACWSVFDFCVCLSYVFFIAVNRYHDHNNFFKEKFLMGWLIYSCRGLALYHHGCKHGSMQAGMVLEN